MDLSFDALKPKQEMKATQEDAAFVFGQHPELSKIGTQESYLKYLETIFPESKIKQVVWHGTDEVVNEKFESHFVDDVKKGYLDEIEKLKPSAEAIAFVNSLGIDERFYDRDSSFGLELHAYRDFRNNPKAILGDETAEARMLVKYRDYIFKKKDYNNISHCTQAYYFAKNKKDVEHFGKNIVVSVIDVRNPRKMQQPIRWQEMSNDDGADAITGTSGIVLENGHYPTFSTIAVFDPSRIHILGSVTDQEAFKEYSANR